MSKSDEKEEERFKERVKHNIIELHRNKYVLKYLKKRNTYIFNFRDGALKLLFKLQSCGRELLIWS